MKGMEYEMQEDSWTPQILHTRNRLIKLLNFKYMIPFMKKKGWLREWSYEPQRQELEVKENFSRTWKIMEFVWLEIMIDDYLFFFPVISSLFEQEHL